MATTDPGAGEVASLLRLGRALSDETRCRLLLRLVRCPAYPSELSESLGISRQSVSNHLKALRDGGLVTAELEGRRVCYRIADERLAHAVTDLAGLSVGERRPVGGEHGHD